MAEKKMNVQSILDKIKKTHTEAFKNVDITGKLNGFTLDSPQLNYVFGGKFVTGRIYELYGPESSGKSTICTYLCMQNQRYNVERPMVVYIDYERTFDADHAAELGLDLSEDSFIFLQPLSGEEGFKLIQEIISQLPVGLVIWDSIGATNSESQLQDAFKATYGGTASVLSSGLKYVNPYLTKYDCSLILINQERAQIGGYSPVPGATTTSGGYARKYFASWRGRVTKVDTIKGAEGESIGIVMKVRNIKSKIGNPFREATSIKLYFDKGIDSDSEYLDFIIKFLCTRKGAYYSMDSIGMKVMGRDGVLKFMEDHPDIYQNLKPQINDLICRRTKFDKVINMKEDEIEAAAATQDDLWESLENDKEEEE